MKKWLFFVVLAFVLAGCAKSNVGTVSQDVQAIKDRGKLIVGSDIPYGVMEFYDSGNVVGIDVDIAKEIAASLNVELEFLDYEWESLFDAVKSGEVDLALASITITPEREQEMLFSIPYFNGGQILLVHNDNKGVMGPLDLEGKKIGVQVDSTSEQESYKYTNSTLITTYPGYDYETVDSGILYDLETGIIDAVIIDYVAAIDIVRHRPLLKIVGSPFTEEFYGIATAKENIGLIDEVNKVLREMQRTDKTREIVNKWS